MNNLSKGKNRGRPGIVEQAKLGVSGFADSYQLFLEQAVTRQCSGSVLNNYGRSAAAVALHFGVCPERLTVEEINTWLYRQSVHQNMSESYFKHTVHGLRFWFRMFGMEDKALRMPPIKKKETLPVVLSKEECRRLIAAPRMHKHRFMLALAYSSGLRMNELRWLKIQDVDTHRMTIHVRSGKGGKDRYVVLSKAIAGKLPGYLSASKPQVYLFNGDTPGQVMGERSIQNAIREAVKRGGIIKHVSMHTLRHSYATHLLEDGLDLFTIQKMMGHSHIQSTLVYVHVAQVSPRNAHSPLDTLYGIQ